MGVSAQKEKRTMKVRGKLLCVFFPLFMLVMLGMLFMANATFSKAMAERSIQNTVSEAKLLQMQISSITGSTEACANFIVKLIGNEKHQKDVTDITRFQYSTYLTTQIRFALDITDTVDNAVFVDVDGTVYHIARSNQEVLHEPVNQELIQRMQKTAGENVWVPSQLAKVAQEAETTPVLVLSKKIMDVATLDTLGYLFLNIREETIAGFYTAIDPQRSLSYIVDDEGTVVSSQNKEMLRTLVADADYRSFLTANTLGTQVRQIDGNDTLCISVPIPTVNWHFVQETPLAELNYGASQITRMVLIMGCVMLGVALVAVGVAAGLITKPLQKLTQAMAQVRAGTLDVRFDWNAQDEIGELSNGFNTMLERIQQLLKDIKREQKQKRRYELALLQAQIKPHFLYNTLDTIFLLSKLGENENAQKTTKALADFYRTSLSSGREIISIQEELQNVSAYLQIQNTRYADVFTYEIAVTPEAAQCRIPKLTIQPIMENAIYHGLKNSPQKGLLKITGEIANGCVVLRVADTGVGMSGERLREVSDFSRAVSVSADSFGLASVDKRIKLYFGESYGISIESEAEQGTVVSIRLPVERELEREEDAEEWS